MHKHFPACARVDILCRLRFTSRYEKMKERWAYVCVCVSKQIGGTWRVKKELVRSTHVAQFATSRWRLPAAISTNLTAPTHHVIAHVDVPRRHNIKWNDKSSHVRTRIFDFYHEINGDGWCEELNCCSVGFERWLDWTHNFEPNSKGTKLFSKLVE